MYVRSHCNLTVHIEPYAMDIACDIYDIEVRDALLLLRQRRYQLLHARDKDISLWGNEFRHNLNQVCHWLVYSAPEDPRVQIPGGARDLDLEISHPALYIQLCC
jgi:hypothetical protein